MRRILLASTLAVLISCGGSGTDGGGNNATQPAASAPAIALSTATAGFAATAGGGNPAAQNIVISNSGSGILGGIAVGSVVYGASQPTGWLSVSVGGTTAPTTLTLTPSLGSLAAGNYTATISISSSASGVTNSPQTVAAALTVAPATVQTGGAQVTLAVGQSTTFLTSPNFAANLTVSAGAQYLVAVVNTDASYTQTEAFSLAGTAGASAAAQLAPIPAPRAAGARAVVAAQSSLEVGGSLPPTMASLGGLAQTHTAMLGDNRTIYEKFGNPGAAWARARTGRSLPLSAAISQTVGTVSKVYVKHAISGSCTSVDSIGARTVAVGQHVIVLADTNRTKWPQSLRPDSSFYQTFANEYDQITFPHVIANIGNPLGYDSQLSNTGKITVTITPVLNNFAGGTGGGSIVAFVNGCDFFPLASSGVNADFSNQTEMFYSWIPGSGGFTVADWEAGLRATAAHETKHIVSYTDRIMNNSPAFEEIWLEEGLAQESAEIWERNFNLATWKGNATFLQTVACEIPLGANAPCDISNNKPYALLGSHLPFFFNYLLAESQSNSEGLGLDTPANYGAGWTIARWATDQYASGGEAAFIKSLVNEPQLSGLSNLSLHTGQTVPLLLTYWNLATAIFQAPGYVASDARVTIPSFNFADIFNFGQTRLTCNGAPCGIFTTSGTPVFPIKPITISTAAAFAKVVNSIPGTSASYFLLSASAAGTESLQLLTPAGVALSAASGLRVAILRVQ